MDNNIILMNLVKYLTDVRDYYNCSLINKQFNKLIKNSKNILYDHHIPLEIEIAYDEEEISTHLKRKKRYIPLNKYLKINENRDLTFQFLKHVRKLRYYIDTDVFNYTHGLNFSFDLSFIKIFKVENFNITLLKHDLDEFICDGVLIKVGNMNNKIHLKNVKLKYNDRNYFKFLNNIKLILDNFKVDHIHLKLFSSENFGESSSDQRLNEKIIKLINENPNLKFSVTTSFNFKNEIIKQYLDSLYLLAYNYIREDIHSLVIPSKNIDIKNCMIEMGDNDKLILPKVENLYLSSKYELKIIANKNLKYLKFKIYLNHDERNPREPKDYIKYLIKLLNNNLSINYLEVEIEDMMKTFYPVLIRLNKYYKKLKYLKNEFHIKTLKIYYPNKFKYILERDENYQKYSVYFLNTLLKTKIYNVLILNRYFDKYNFKYYKKRKIVDDDLILYN